MGTLPEMSRTELIDDIARLRAHIDQVEQAGATRLPPEPQLSSEMNISRGRLRTVLQTLEKEGLIWRHVGKGTFIGPKQPDPASPLWSRDISISDIIGARMMLEPQLAAQAAIHTTAENLDACDKCLVEMGNATTYLQWKRGDEKLHRLIAEATGNKLALLMYDTLRAQLRTGLDERLTKVFGDNTSPRDMDSEHASIIQAIRSGDPEAAEQAMRVHLQHVRTKLFGLR